MTKKLFFFILFGMIFSFTSQAFATDYYVAPASAPSGWSNGSNSNNGLSKSAPFLTIKYGCSQMSGGDTLIIADGTYTGVDNMIDNIQGYADIPQGSASAYTVIKAENTGGVIIDGQATSRPIYVEGNHTVDSVTGDGTSHNYIEINGIIGKNSSSSCITATHVDHVKLINVGAVDPADGNTSGIQINYSSYILLEGGYVWGAGRYKISTYHSNHSIIRNCVIRYDRGNALASGPQGGYQIYSSTNIEVQNCIDIDGGARTYQNSPSELSGSFGAATTSSTSSTGPINFTNIMALNTSMKFGSWDWNSYAADTHVTNAIGWDVTTGGTWDFIHTQGDADVENATFGVVDTQTGGAVTFSWVNGWKAGNTNTMQTTIFYNFLHGGLFYDIETSDNNNIYGLGGIIDVNGTTSTNTKTYDPTSNGLLYLPRIESSSQLETDGIGATITYQYGTSGTMWGDTGYATLTTTPLWPFPNEDIIKTKMQAYTYDSGNLTGDRGFASSTAKQLDGTTDVTLTSYIWEYLGNQMPSDIYSGSSSFVGGTTIYRIVTQPSE